MTCRWAKCIRWKVLGPTYSWQNKNIQRRLSPKNVACPFKLGKLPSPKATYTRTGKVQDRRRLRKLRPSLFQQPALPPTQQQKDTKHIYAQIVQGKIIFEIKYFTLPSRKTKSDGATLPPQEGRTETRRGRPLYQQQTGSITQHVLIFVCLIFSNLSNQVMWCDLPRQTNPYIPGTARRYTGLHLPRRANPFHGSNNK